jgi:uncharacterized protein YqjF (DUF2071 family)
MYALLFEAQVNWADSWVPTAIGQAVILACFMLERWYAWKREARQRQWDMQDRMLARARTTAQIVDTKKTVMATASEVKQHIEETKSVLTDGMQTKIDLVLSKFDGLTAERKPDEQQPSKPAEPK